MTWLIIGIALWYLAHLFKRLAPGLRANMGDKGKGLVALGLLAGIVLMVIGYRSAAVIPVYAPVPGMGHLNNLLMVVAVFFFFAGQAGGVVASKLRHSMLTGTLIWAVGHLLVNGDLASILLFGLLGLWAILAMLLINRGDGPWTPPTPGPVSKDLRAGLIALIVFAGIAAIHWWLGYNPFLGTYR